MITLVSMAGKIVALGRNIATTKSTGWRCLRTICRRTSFFIRSFLMIIVFSLYSSLAKHCLSSRSSTWSSSVVFCLHYPMKRPLWPTMDHSLTHLHLRIFYIEDTCFYIILQAETLVQQTLVLCQLHLSPFVSLPPLSAKFPIIRLQLSSLPVLERMNRPSSTMSLSTDRTTPDLLLRSTFKQRDEASKYNPAPSIRHITNIRCRDKQSSYVVKLPKYASRKI